jgi:hypothetical protein
MGGANNGANKPTITKKRSKITPNRERKSLFNAMIMNLNSLRINGQ